MLEHIWNTPLETSDLKVYQYGYEACKPKHEYGPASRDHYLLHFISSGSGVFYSKNKEYTLKEGEGFLISPGVITSYRADSDTPWTYSWIGFNGSDAEYYLSQAGLSPENPVFSYNNTEEFTKLFTELTQLEQGTIVGQIKMIGYLYMILGGILENAVHIYGQGKAFFSSKEEYVKNALLYIQRNYARNISVKEIANYIGLNRSYFGSIFKELTNMSPQEFIIDFRIDKAKKMLENVSMNIGDVSRSVGYDDPLTFSKLFKKNVGISPNAYKKSRINFRKQKEDF